MNSKPIKTILLAAFVGGMTLTACDTGQRPGEPNVEDSDHVDEGSLNEGYTSDEYPADTDTANLEDKYYDNAEGAVHAGDGKTEGKKRGETDNQ
ncbi:hypothetical protein H7F15_10230 [Pontibacter sp. Tf4]|uniref:hypothetical protein n=1 Tax=Pontibacter sp. Tf4 TaxID=2761620 RepID=UPI001628E388|nr:hypothetical protein [Pontibacter sp. Tf4]MBB6611412.1 hypothetical protein [Pontibacter sp. Tf4]